MTDTGKEFYNKHLKQLLDKNTDITIFSTENEEKYSVVERWNRKIEKQNETWNNLLFKVIHSTTLYVSPKLVKE